MSEGPRTITRAKTVEGQFAVPTGGLALNLFPACLSNSTVTVWSGLYSSPEGTADLEASHAGITAWRDPDDGSRLYVWHTTELFVPPTGFSEVTVRLEESPRLFQRLIDDAVDRRLAELGFDRKGDGWVNYEKGSLLAEVPALAGAVDESIGIYPKIIVESLFTKTAAGTLIIGIVVDVLYASRMGVSAAEWIRAGLTNDLIGTNVLLMSGTEEAIRFPHLVGKTVGRINGIKGTRCVLTDHRDDNLGSVPLAAVSPVPTRTNLALYLRARYEKAYQAGEKQLASKFRELVRPQNRYKLARGLVLSRLQPKDTPYADDGLLILPGVHVRFDDMARTTADRFPARRLTSPEYSFDQAGSKYALRVDLGLRKYGPYDQQRMRQKSLRLLVVVPAENQGEVKLAMQKLVGGVPTPKDVFSGLRNMYRLDGLQISYAFARTAKMEDYSEAVHRAIAEAPAPATGEPRFHMLLTVIREVHRRLPDSENPYFQTKALALVADQGMPTQAITIEKLRHGDGDLQYIMNTMALACYAKLGGTSHVLKLPLSDSDSPTELIFGIGHSSGSTREYGQFGDRLRTVGFATVFRANGEYLYNDSTPYSDDSNYEVALESTIRRAIEQVASFEQLPDGAPLRLIFHVPRRPGRRERGPILNALRKLPRFKISFALVHVNDDHHLQLFDLDNTHPKTYNGTPKPEAVFLPRRGIAVTLGPRERLITFVGLDQYKGNGSPSPLRITLDRESTFTDIEYLTQQLYLLSFMSARSLTPGVAPVTISYAESVAHLTGHLRGVQSWTVELITAKLGRKLWFV